MTSTSTTRLGMNKPTPGTGEAVNVATQLNANWDKIDAAIGATICTSGTRPGSPWDGQIIRETDTRSVYIRNNTQSTWDLLFDGGAWNTYTPVFSTATGSPSVGNGTLTGRYLIIGKTMQFNIDFLLGTTTNTGGGIWRFSLPVAPVIGGLFSAFANGPGGARWSGSGRLIIASATGDNMRIVVADNSGGITPTNPFTWASTHGLTLQGTIEIA